MSDIITTLFQSFTTTISSLASGVKDAFLNIFYVDPDAATLVVSDVAKFGFLMLGLSMAIGLVYGAISLIRK